MAIPPTQQSPVFLVRAELGDMCMLLPLPSSSATGFSDGVGFDFFFAGSLATAFLCFAPLRIPLWTALSTTVFVTPLRTALLTAFSICSLLSLLNWSGMKRKRIATARFTADIYGQGPTEQHLIEAGMSLVFLHRTDDDLSTHFAVEKEMPQWRVKDTNKHPIEYVVFTDVFDSSTREAE
jgi:hypothetical protein